MALTKTPLDMLDLGGGGLSFRNAIINGNCRVAQRGSVSASNNAYTYGGADRIMAYPNSFSTFSGTVTQVTGTATASGVAQALTSVTTTGTGSIIFATRLEAKDCARFNGKTVTIGAKMYHEVSGGLTGAIQLYKANAADNFSGVTQINTTVTVGTIPLNTFTQVSATFTLGSTDASNGLMIFWQFQSVGAVTGKTFAVGDLQMTEGTVALPMSVPPIAYDEALCKRYYQKLTYAGSGMIATGVTYSTSAAAARINFVQEMRAAPTVTLPSSGQTSGTISFLNGGSYPAVTGSHTAQAIDTQGFKIDSSGYTGLAASSSAAWLYGSNSSVSILANAEL